MTYRHIKFLYFVIWPLSNRKLRTKCRERRSHLTSSRVCYVVITLYDTRLT